jgi:cobalt/nickel transport system permease protein
MHHDFLDRFSRLDSSVHRASPAWKLALALATVLAVVVVPVVHSLFFLALALVLALVAGVSGVPAGFILGRLVLLELFVAGIAVLSLFQPGGVGVALSILVKSTLCLATMILLTNTTPFAGILGVLRKVGIPRLLITVLALMYRYLFVLIDEAERMQRARRSRTFMSTRGHVWTSWSTVIGQLFVRSTERAERIYAAMTARGWR